MPSADKANTPNDINMSNGMNGNDGTSNGIRRQLFPKEVEDDAEIEEAIARQIREILNRNAEEARERWNFDFKNDTPLEGDWIWEPVDI